MIQFVHLQRCQHSHYLHDTAQHFSHVRYIYPIQLAIVSVRVSSIITRTETSILSSYIKFCVHLWCVFECVCVCCVNVYMFVYKLALIFSVCFVENSEANYTTILLKSHFALPILVFVSQSEHQTPFYFRSTGFNIQISKAKLHASTSILYIFPIPIN